MTAALLRYRIAAFIVGVLLLLLCGEIYLNHVKDNDDYAWIAFVHGWFYLIYLILAFDLYRRSKIPTGLFAAMIVAGLVPGMVFIVERRLMARGMPVARASRDAGVPQA